MRGTLQTSMFIPDAPGLLNPASGVCLYVLVEMMISSLPVQVALIGNAGHS